MRGQVKPFQVHTEARGRVRQVQRMHTEDTPWWVQRAHDSTVGQTTLVAVQAVEQQRELQY